MPRIRSIKPEFWTSEQILECSRNARLLFIGLWNFCDDQGRHPFRAKQIKAEVFPGDDIDSEKIMGMLAELYENDLITVYVNNSKEFLQVNGWNHQRIDKPQPGKYPGPFDEGSKIIRGTDRECSGSDPEPFPPDRIGEDRKGKELNPSVTSGDATVGVQPGDESKPPGPNPDPAQPSLLTGDGSGQGDGEPESPKEPKAKSRAAKKAVNYSDEFEELWQARPRRLGPENKAEAFRVYTTRINQGESHENMLNGVKRYKRFLEHRGKIKSEYVKMLSTFLGPNKHYLDDFEIPDDEPPAGGQKMNLPRAAAYAR